MKPVQITADSFSKYPRMARSVAIRNISTIQSLPLIFAVLLLREVYGYDWQFPAERRVIDSQLHWLASLPRSVLQQKLDGFARIALNRKLMHEKWVRNPQPFLNELTAYLWSSHQMDRFRRVAEQYGDDWRSAVPAVAPPLPRLSIVVFGKDVTAPNYELFQKLRPNGIYFPHIDTENAWPCVVDFLISRATAHPEPYLHWYIDGGEPQALDHEGIAQISWAKTAGLRSAVLQRIHEVVESGFGGPELLRTQLLETTPRDLGVAAKDNDEVMERFRVSVLTQGSGTQIFSTTFAQWSAREALRRAQPCTLLLRYAPRQRKLPMNELLSNASVRNQVDPEGSLMDADIGAYYTWIDQERLSGQGTSAFLAWSEDRGEAVAVGPGLPHGTTATTTPTMQQLLSLL